MDNNFAPMCSQHSRAKKCQCLPWYVNSNLKYCKIAPFVTFILYKLVRFPLIIIWKSVEKL